MRPALALVALAVGVGAVVAGCEPYRIEYHRRPAYYQQLVEEPLPDRVVRDDGTIMIYNAPEEASAGALPGGEDPKLFKAREVADDGTVTLQALLPEHVLANLLYSLRYEEYELLWDQLLAESTKQAYEAGGGGHEAFADFLRRHRIDIARTVNRMRLGLTSHETVVESVGDDIVVCRFWPQTASLFKFKHVAMVRDGWELKLLRVY